MKVYTCKDHAYFWPVGVASVVVARSEEEARRLLMTALKMAGLDDDKPFTLQELDITVPDVRILCTGDY